MFTQYRGHQSRDERSWFTCFTIVMMGWGHHHPPDHSLHFHFLCNVETLHVCIYKLCCSCMFFMISSALGGEDCKAQQHPLWIPFISGSRFQVRCLDRPKINYGQNGVSCFSFSFFFLFKCQDWIDVFIQRCANSHSCFCPRPSKITGYCYLFIICLPLPLLTASTFSPLTPGQRGVTDILATFWFIPSW